MVVPDREQAVLRVLSPNPAHHQRAGVLVPGAGEGGVVGLGDLLGGDQLSSVRVEARLKVVHWRPGTGAGCCRRWARTAAVTGTVTDIVAPGRRAAEITAPV